MAHCNEKEPPEHWRDRIASVPPTARNIREAIEAWEFCECRYYGRAVKAEMEVCLSDCESDEEWLKIFLWLMPHVRRQVEQKAKEDSERFFARERRRSWRASW